MKIRTTPILLISALPLWACNKQPTQPVSQPEQGVAVRVSQFGEFNIWDKNSDGELTQEEFQERLRESRLYHDFDGDGDGELTDLEFRTGLYNAWDVNGDEVVDVYEYRWGQGAWFADNTMFGRFEDWDQDGDRELTWVELNAAAEAPSGSQWDLDGNGEISDLEFQTSLWNAWDLDGDEVVDIYEYRGEDS